MHTFAVGEIVTFIGEIGASGEPPAYEVVRLLPASEDGTPQYRIRKVGNKQERVAREYQLLARRPGK